MHTLFGTWLFIAILFSLKKIDGKTDKKLVQDGYHLHCGAISSYTSSTCSGGLELSANYNKRKRFQNQKRYHFQKFFNEAYSFRL